MTGRFPLEKGGGGVGWGSRIEDWDEVSMPKWMFRSGKIIDLFKKKRS